MYGFQKTRLIVRVLINNIFTVRCAQAHLSPESSADQLQSVLEFPLEGATLEVSFYDTISSFTGYHSN